MRRSFRQSRKPLPLAKLTPPHLPPVLDRPRLYRLLHRARAKPILWITGPPGSGKTTLVAQYLRARKVRSLWYNVDERDSEPATFFHYLGLAARQLAPRYRRPLPHLTPTSFARLSTLARTFFETLYSRLKPPAVLVFDNYHRIPPDSPLHDVLQAGLSELPHGMTAIIVSRHLPLPAFAGFEASQRLAVMDPEALELTEREFEGIVRLHAQTAQRPFDKMFLKGLHRRMHGWAAGLILSLRGHQPDVLFDYLGGQCLDGLPPETHTFVLKTAHLPVMTAPMAAQLTGMPTAGEILAQLYRDRYFTERWRERELWYRYQPLFRDALLARGMTVFEAWEHAVLQRTAATLLVQAGRVEEAGQLYQSDAGSYAVRITTLGRFAVERDGTLLPRARKAPRRLFNVLQAIIAFGGRDVPVSRVTDALWPEAEGDAAYRALITALARLRKALGDTRTLVLENGRLRVAPDLVWVDATSFETLAQEAERAVLKGQPAESERLAIQAVCLYRGPFLAEEPDGPWAQPARERLRAQYVRLVETCMRASTERGEREQAVAWAERAIATEPLVEPLYRLLMTTLHQAGRPAEVQTVYARCRKTLLEEDGRLPSPDTVLLLNSLRSQ